MKIIKVEKRSTSTTQIIIVNDCVYDLHDRCYNSLQVWSSNTEVNLNSCNIPTLNFDASSLWASVSNRIPHC